MSTKDSKVTRQPNLSQADQGRGERASGPKPGHSGSFRFRVLVTCSFNLKVKLPDRSLCCLDLLH
jgi:hypothetical protein